MVVSNNTTSRGFTLVELMLAMAFLSAILLFATLTFVQALAIYNKGVSVSQINETGRTLTNDLNRSTNGAASFSVSGLAKPQFLCVGKTAYMWNLSDPSNPTPGNQYRMNGQPIGLVRTNDGFDARDKYCSDSPASHTIDPSEATNLIGSQVRVLDVTIAKPNTIANPNSSLEAPLIKFSLTIGTRSQDGAVDPIVQPGYTYWSCPRGTIGTFCAVGTYSTTIYVPSGS